MGAAGAQPINWDPTQSSAFGAVTGKGTVWGRDYSMTQDGGGTPPATPTDTTPAQTSALPTYLDNKGEWNFRNSYLKSLKPNTNFNVSGEQNQATSFSKAGK